MSELKEAKDAIKTATKELESFEPIHEIAIAGKCKDKDGNDTKVLVIDTDKEGYIGLLLEMGNPYTLGGNGEPKEDGKKLNEYLYFMSNIDLKDSKNHKALGATAILKAKGIVSDFFMLNLVSSIRLGETARK